MKKDTEDGHEEGYEGKDATWVWGRDGGLRMKVWRGGKNETRTASKIPHNTAAGTGSPSTSSGGGR